jgi:hypothetical protein
MAIRFGDLRQDLPKRSESESANGKGPEIGQDWAYLPMKKKKPRPEAEADVLTAEQACRLFKGPGCCWLLKCWNEDSPQNQRARHR